ncbi:MAG: ferric reductase [Silicimonas sp.]|nr:ferric reductase [Silicimonas sp.]
MRSKTSPAKALLIWLVFVAAVVGPLALAANSPLLAWRDPIYIASGFAGITALALLFVQPLLARNLLPNLKMHLGRRIHRLTGAFLVIAIITHVAGLWITSPPDVVDALLFASPTPFSAWGVIAMWAAFAAALVAALRRKLRLKPHNWRRLHGTFAAIIVVASVVHALLIEGTMEPFSKAALCILVIAAGLFALRRGRVKSYS